MMPTYDMVSPLPHHHPTRCVQHYYSTICTWHLCGWLQAARGLRRQDTNLVRCYTRPGKRQSARNTDASVLVRSPPRGGLLHEQRALTANTEYERMVHTRPMIWTTILCFLSESSFIRKAGNDQYAPVYTNRSMYNKSILNKRQKKWSL